MLRFIAGYVMIPVVTLMVFCYHRQPQTRGA